MKESVLQIKSFELAVKIVSIARFLQEDKKEFILSKQLLRSGTSVGANMREAKHAVSSKDFVHKLSIVQKECEETMYWLELLEESNYLENKNEKGVYDLSVEIMKMIISSIKTVKAKLN